MLPQLSTEEVSLGEFTKAYVELQGLYSTCAIRHDCLIDAVNADSAAAELCEKNLEIYTLKKRILELTAPKVPAVNPTW